MVHFCLFLSKIRYLELVTLYKQCPDDREIEEYIRRIQALKQRIIEAGIHMRLIEVNTIILFSILYS